MFKNKTKTSRLFHKNKNEIKLENKNELFARSKNRLDRKS